MYRSSITEVSYETNSNIDTDSEDYETACSESSFVTCLSQSVSADSHDEDLETMSSSSCDTVVDEVFTGHKVFDIVEQGLLTTHVLSSKARWNAETENLLHNYPRA